MDTTNTITQVLPGASIHESKRGLAIGGFSMPPRTAQDMLRAAGLTVEDHFGQTIVKS